MEDETIAVLGSEDAPGISTYTCACVMVMDVLPGGHPTNNIAAVCHPQWDGPAMLVSSNSLTSLPSRDQR